MTDMRTTYLGMELAHPLMPGASPLVDDLDTVRRLEDAGASAIVMYSLFEEQIETEREAAYEAFETGLDGHAEARSYMPPPDIFTLGPDGYLEQLRRIKEAVGVPVIASLNGASATGWVDYATLLQQAGADAIELNVYFVANDPDCIGPAVDERVLMVMRAVRQAVSIPLAVKLSPYFSSVWDMASRLEDAGADGIVLFNRFYQPDFDIETLETVPRLDYSAPAELPLRLRWLAALSGRVRPSLAATGGVHSHVDAIKAVMAGAHAVQTVSALLKGGPGKLREMVDGMRLWMEERGYESVRQMQGSMSLGRCPDPVALERANYMRVLKSWRLPS